MTLFNRGHRQHPDWRELVSPQGDRDNDLGALRGEGLHWDLAIDTCCYRPEQAASLSTRPGGALRAPHLHLHHQRLSRLRPARMDESAPLHEVAPTGQPPATVCSRYCVRPSIGPAGERLCILRPGVLCGPFDPTGRLAWWVRRVQQRWALAAAGEGQDRLQYLDVRDGAEFVLRAAEQRLEGCYNLIKPGIPWRTGWSASPPGWCRRRHCNPSGGPGPP